VDSLDLLVGLVQVVPWVQLDQLDQEVLQVYLEKEVGLDQLEPQDQLGLLVLLVHLEEEAQLEPLALLVNQALEDPVVHQDQLDPLDLLDLLVNLVPEDLQDQVAHPEDQVE